MPKAPHHVQWIHGSDITSLMWCQYDALGFGSQTVMPAPHYVTSEYLPGVTSCHWYAIIIRSLPSPSPIGYQWLATQIFNDMYPNAYSNVYLMHSPPPRKNLGYAHGKKEQSGKIFPEDHMRMLANSSSIPLSVHKWPLDLSIFRGNKQFLKLHSVLAQEDVKFLDHLTLCTPLLRFLFLWYRGDHK